MKKDVHEFLWVWLLAAAYHALDQIDSPNKMQRFLVEAWQAFLDRQNRKVSAADFGKNWH